MDIEKVEWISANRIALGLGNDIEIWEIDEEGEATKSRVIKQIKHGKGDVSIGISTILQLSYHILLFFL